VFILATHDDVTIISGNEIPPQALAAVILGEADFSGCAGGANISQFALKDKGF
jgi:hypothetical protein